MAGSLATDDARDETGPPASPVSRCDMPTADAAATTLHPAAAATARWRPARLTPPADADRGLVARLQRGDQSAVQELYVEHGGRVVSYLAYVLRDRVAADDVCQEVFVEVWRKGGSYDPDRGSLNGWIMTIARTRAIDQLRKRVPEPRDTTIPGAAVVEPEDPAAAMEVVDDRWRMAALLDELPAEQATTLRLRFHGDMSQSEIAEAMDVPLGTVKTRMARALKRLRELMDDEGGGR